VTDAVLVGKHTGHETNIDTSQYGSKILRAARAIKLVGRFDMFDMFAASRALVLLNRIALTTFWID
jgi:hypothetical protein